MQRKEQQREQRAEFAGTRKKNTEHERGIAATEPGLFISPTAMNSPTETECFSASL